MDFNDVLFKKDRNIGIISINRPNALNALNSNVLGELDNTVDMVIDDDDVHILIITGEGRAFVAGADISEMKDMNMVAARKFAEKGSKLLENRVNGETSYSCCKWICFRRRM